MKFDIVHFIEEINKPFEIESADTSDIHLEGITLPIKAIPLNSKNENWYRKFNTYTN